VRRIRFLKSMVIGAALPVLFLADLSPHAPFGLSVPREARAIVGAPLTPVSVAGVARRTTRRAVVATSAATQSAAATTAQQQQATAQQQAATAQQQATTAQQQAAAAQAQPAAPPQPAQSNAGAAPAVGSMVTTLPGGCVQEVQGQVAYQKCGSVYYRPAFQGNNLVYVVQLP
jgi:hypothetical protein